MIPHKNEHKFSSSGLPNVIQEMGIAPEVLFHVTNSLSSGLYSDKPTAVQRELTANAYDSHVSAGVIEPPIIHMCTVLEPWWSIQDFGTGLNHKEMYGLFASFGGSTKRDDNKVVGNKGYGSKSYFAYTDAASITAIKDGVKREYSAFRADNGAPSITLISEQPTNERNGLLVSFGVLGGDIYAFQEAGKQVYRRYDPHPVIEGMDDFVPEPYETVMEGQGWVFRKEKGNEDNSYYREPTLAKTAYAIQGNIAYPISLSSIRHALPEEFHFMGELPFDIVFPIGELETADSREALQYNERTITAIVDKLTEMHTEITNIILPQIFAGCTTKWEAIQKLTIFIGDIENRKYKKLIKETAKWNGNSIDDVLDIPWQVYRDGENQLGRCPRLYEITERRFSFQTLNMSSGEVSNYGDTSLYGKDEYIVLVSDETEKRLPSRLKTYMFNTYGEAKKGDRWGSNKQSTYPVVIFFKGPASSIKEFIPQLEGHPWHKFDDFIPEYPTVRRAKGIGQAVTGRVNRRVVAYNERGGGWNNNENRQQWDDVTVDTNTQTTGVYVNLRKWEVHSSSNYIGHWGIERIRSLAITFNLMLPTDKIYGVPGGQKNELAPLAGWHDLTALIDSVQTKWEVSKGAPSEVTYNQVHNSMKRIAEMSDYFKDHSIMDKGVIKTFLKRVPIDSSDKIKYHINLANNKIDSVGMNTNDLFDQSLADKITGEYDAVNTQYPMLAYLSLGKHEVIDLKNYIDLVERTKPFFVPRSNKPTLT